MKFGQQKMKRRKYSSFLHKYIQYVLIMSLAHGTVAGAAEEEGEGKSQEGGCQGICLRCGFCGRIGYQPSYHPRIQQQVTS
jgi:hypothetical protein